MTVVIDFLNINNRDEFYTEINSKFDFEYEHNNLDSLYDELTCICYELKIVIKNLDDNKMNSNKYFSSIKQLFDDLDNELDNVKITYEN